MRLVDTKEARLIHLTEIAWAALIQADPSKNPDAIAVSARKLAEAFLKLEVTSAS